MARSALTDTVPQHGGVQVLPTLAISSSMASLTAMAMALLLTCGTCTRTALAIEAGTAAVGRGHQLSSPRRQASALTVGEYAVFAGGYTHGSGNNAATASRAIDVFDADARLVGTYELRIGRGAIAATSWHDLAFFAGGQDEHKNNTAVMEIFNVTSRTIVSVQNLTSARAMASAVTVGDFVLVAGGEASSGCFEPCKPGDSRVVDIWDARRARWVSHEGALSVPRKKMAAATAGGKAFFGAGFSSEEHRSMSSVDIWDSATQAWSTTNLSSARMRIQSASLTARDGTEYALFIGGLGEFAQPDGTPYATGGFCTTVDIYNARTGEWSWTNLSRGRYEFSVAEVGTPRDTIIVSGGKQASISTSHTFYDP